MHGKQKRLTFCVLRENDGEEGKIAIKGAEKGQKWEKMGSREKKTKKEKGRKEWEKGEKERIRRKIARKDS